MSIKKNVRPSSTSSLEVGEDPISKIHLSRRSHEILAFLFGIAPNDTALMTITRDNTRGNTAIELSASHSQTSHTANTAIKLLRPSCLTQGILHLSTPEGTKFSLHLSEFRLKNSTHRNALWHTLTLDQKYPIFALQHQEWLTQTFSQNSISTMLHHPQWCPEESLYYLNNIAYHTESEKILIIEKREGQPDHPSSYEFRLYANGTVVGPTHKEITWHLKKYIDRHARGDSLHIPKTTLHDALTIEKLTEEAIQKANEYTRIRLYNVIIGRTGTREGIIQHLKRQGDYQTNPQAQELHTLTFVPSLLQSTS